VETIVDEPDVPIKYLGGYDAGERFAILEHKYYLGIELGFDPGTQCAVASWELGYAMQWRQQRQQTDCQAQMVEIELHRTHMSRQRRCEVSWEAAARDWIGRYAAEWRIDRDRPLIA
jgi:hypothetical protein